MWETLIPKQSRFQEVFSFLNQSKLIGLCWKQKEGNSSSGMHRAISERLEFSCIGLISDEDGDTHGIDELIQVSLMKSRVNIKLFDTF